MYESNTYIYIKAGWVWVDVVSVEVVRMIYVVELKHGACLKDDN